jgi:hypothetical protein
MNERLDVLQVRKILGILCGGVTVAILFATLWPFNPLPRNRVRWLPGVNGIEFDGVGVVMGKSSAKVEDDEATGSCTLELWLQPATVESIHTIVGFYTPNTPTQLLIRQWTDGLLVSHALVDGRRKIGASKFDVDHAFHPGKLLFLTIASGASGTTVYLDGREARVFPGFRVSRNDVTGQIVIGTSPTEYEPWSGQIRGLAIYSRELESADVFRHYRDWTDPGTHPPDLEGAVARYVFTEAGGSEIQNEVGSEPDLEIPRYFSVPQKVVLKSPVKEFEANRTYAEDIVMNVVGFVPLGLVVCTYLALTNSRQTSILYATLAGGSLSFVIEMLQAFIPRRNSGITDIITNALGSALGAAIAHSILVRGILAKVRSIPVREDVALRRD